MPKTSDITYDVSRGFIARPDENLASDARRVGVVVLQEWWGLVPHIKDVTTRFAEAGYVALAPDLYHGKNTVDAAEAEHLMQGLDWARAVHEITGAVRQLRAAEGVSRVAVVGFCMGGALAILSAIDHGVDAYAAFYGFPPADTPDLGKIKAPGLIFFGEEENFFSIPAAKTFAQAQTSRSHPTEVVVYPGAGHAFFNDTRPEAYRAEPAADAWKRTLALFGRL